MPIDLVKPIEGIARLKNAIEDDKPKEMTEYQKQKIAVANQKNEIAKGKLEETKKKNAIEEQEAERKLNKENRIAANQSKTNESLLKRKELEAESNLLKEKRLLQNAKNRQARIKAQQSLSDKVDSMTTTNKNRRSHLDTLKTGPQKVGFSNIIQGGGVEDE